jgi:hypothetical protein
MSILVPTTKMILRSWHVKLTAHFLLYGSDTALILLARITLRVWRWRQKVLAKR